MPKPPIREKIKITENYYNLSINGKKTSIFFNKFTNEYEEIDENNIETTIPKGYEGKKIKWQNILINDDEENVLKRFFINFGNFLYLMHGFDEYDYKIFTFWNFKSQYNKHLKKMEIYEALESEYKRRGNMNW